MKYLPNIAGALLGLAFIAFGGMFLLKMIPDMPPPPEGSLMAAFTTTFWATGWMHFVKVCEVVGGILTAIPKTRNWGLLVLGPIILNILAAHQFVMGGLKFDPILAVVGVLALYLLINARKKFAGLLN